jgi:hypothetical protein
MSTVTTITPRAPGKIYVDGRTGIPSELFVAIDTILPPIGEEVDVELENIVKANIQDVLKNVFTSFLTKYGGWKWYLNKNTDTYWYFKPRVNTGRTSATPQLTKKEYEALIAVSDEDHHYFRAENTTAYVADSLCNFFHYRPCSYLLSYENSKQSLSQLTPEQAVRDKRKLGDFVDNEEEVADEAGQLYMYTPGEKRRRVIPDLPPAYLHPDTERVCSAIASLVPADHSDIPKALFEDVWNILSQIDTTAVVAPEREVSLPFAKWDCGTSSSKNVLVKDLKATFQQMWADYLLQRKNRPEGWGEKKVSALGAGGSMVFIKPAFRKMPLKHLQMHDQGNVDITRIKGEGWFDKDFDVIDYVLLKMVASTIFPVEYNIFFVREIPLYRV